VSRYLAVPAPLLARLLAACVAGLGLGALVLVAPPLALAVAAAFALGLVGLSRPDVLGAVVIAAAAMASGLERGRLLPLLRPNEAALMYAAGLGFVVIVARRAPVRGNLQLAGAAQAILVAGTMVVPAAAYLARGVALTVDDTLLLLSPLQYILLFWLFARLPMTSGQRRRLLALMLGCGALVAAVGLLQAARFGPVIDLLHRWYPSSHEVASLAAGRVTSLMTAWNALGIFLMINLLIASALIISRPRALNAWLVVPVFAVGVAGLLVSGSYAGLLGLLGGVLVLAALLRVRPAHVVALGLVLALVGLVSAAVFEPLLRGRFEAQFGHGGVVPETLAFRLQVWRDVYLPVIRTNLVWGAHLTVPDTLAWRFAESQYLSLLFSLGLVGLFAFLGWLGLTLAWLAGRLSGARGFGRPITAAALVILAVMAVAGLTNAVFTYSGAADYLWIMLGLVAAEVGAPVPPALPGPGGG
jgi:hypothetical protein